MHATSVRFIEVMTGTISRRQPSSGVPFALHLTVNASNLRQFLVDPDHTATLSGWVDCRALGGRLAVERGTCNFFPRGEPRRAAGLRYWLIFRDRAGTPFTLRGEKYLRAGEPGRVWVDTTTLYVRLFEGQMGPGESDGQDGIAEGVVRIHPVAFARQLTTFRSEGRSAGVRARALIGFLAFFIGGLWSAYVLDGRPRRAARAIGESR